MATRLGSSIIDTTRRDDIASSLSDKDYREAFIEQEITAGVPFQIRALRVQRGWSQRKLGEMAGGMAQETISLLENPNYGRMNIVTLLRLAAAFDVGLMLRFVPFSDVVDWASDLSPARLAVPSYKDDTRLHSSSGDLDIQTESTGPSTPSLLYDRTETEPDDLTRILAIEPGHGLVRDIETSADTLAELQTAA